MTMTMERDATVAETILDLLGGAEFQKAARVKSLVATSRSLEFRLPSSPTFVQDGINAVMILADTNGLYTMTFEHVGGPRSGFKRTLVDRRFSLYENLIRSEFSEVTGLVLPEPAEPALRAAS